MSTADEARAEEWTEAEMSAYRTWMFSGEDGEPGEGWEIQERAFIGGYRASRKPEAAPSDTDLKKWLVDRLYDSGAYSHLIPEYQADEIHELADKILSRSQPVQVAVTADMVERAWGVLNAIGIAANLRNRKDTERAIAREMLVAALGGGA